jgi:hypothetical protein
MAIKNIYELNNDRIISNSIVHKDGDNNYKNLSLLLIEIENKLNKLLNNKVVLFTGSTNGAITLEKSVEKFKYIEIFYSDNDETYSSVKVFEPNNKYVDLTTLARWGSTFYIKQKRILISGEKITNGNTTEVQFKDTPKNTINTTANNIIITKIIGYTE